MKKLIILIQVIVLFSCITNKYLPENYKEQFFEEYDSPEAEFIVRFGDIDNLGFGWPFYFNPFSGESTPIHDYPWFTNKNDKYYTDKILVVSSFNGNSKNGFDGYTDKTFRKNTYPGDIILKFNPPKFKIKNAIMQIFVDDFQPKKWGAEYQVLMNGSRIYELEDIINNLDQTGPIGKLITFNIPDKIIKILNKGEITLKIDDPITGAGDGFAFDFFRILINTKIYKNVTNIHGTVYDYDTKKIITNAKIKINNNQFNSTTDDKGEYKILNVISGLAVISVNSNGYKENTTNIDLISGQNIKLDFYLKTNKELLEIIDKIKKSKKGDEFSFSDILFYSDTDVIKNESFPILDKIALALLEKKDIEIELIGHTNSTGNPENELSISKKRSNKVAEYLINKGISKNRIKTSGYGSTQLLENKISDINRRVVIKILKTKK